MFGKQKKSVPRNGHTHVVGSIARISGCSKQKEVSNEDQIDHGKEAVDHICEGPMDYRILAATKGKGERLDRPELEVIEKAILSKEYDIIVTEDLGRIIRGVDAARLCGLAVDCGTRVLALNDGIDTANDTWEQDVIDACASHVGHNVHTSKRIKFKMMNRFLRYGAVASRPIYGYVVPAGAKTYDDWRTNPDATAIYDHWFTLIETTLNASAVADWLNENGIKPNKWSKKRGNTKWDCRMVMRVTRNTLLKGMPGRGFKHTVKVHATGRRVSRKNPDGPQFREYPHLAHIDPARFDRVNAALTEAHKGRGRKPDGVNGRIDVPKKRTLFPGQHILCGACRHPFYWGGHGEKEHMMCAQARDYACWNAATFDGMIAGERILAAVLDAVASLPEFDETFRAKVEAKVREQSSRRSADLQAAEAERSVLVAEIRNLVEAIKGGGLLELLSDDLKAATASKNEVEARISKLKTAVQQLLVLPPVEELKEKARTMVGDLQRFDPKFNDALKRLLPDLTAYPYRACDGGQIVFRATATLDLSSLVSLDGDSDELAQQLRRTLCVDLFDPPQRVAFRTKVIKMRAEGRTEKSIAAELGLTVTAVQSAAALDRLMQNLGLSDPYVRITEPPTGMSRIKRHLHPRYKFRPRGDDQAA